MTDHASSGEAAPLQGREARLQFLLDEMARAREDERQQLAVAIHDRVLQNLAAAAIMLDRDSLASMDAAEVRQQATDVRELLAATTVEIRSLIRGVSPLHVEHQPLAVALENHARALERDHQCRFDLHLELPDELDRDTWLLVHCITADAMADAARRTTTLDMKGWLSEASVHVEIVEEGSAADLEGSLDVERPAEAALAMTFERVRAMGGTAGVEALPGDRLRLSYELPLVRGRVGPAATR